MKFTRAAFLAVVAAALVTGGAALATPGNGHGHGGGSGGGHGHAKKKVVANGTVVSVDSEAGTFVLHVNGRHGGDVTVVTDENTSFVRSDDTAGSFADLAEGVKAQAKGKPNEDGSIQAARVLIKLDDGGDG